MRVRLHVLIILDQKFIEECFHRGVIFDSNENVMKDEEQGGYHCLFNLLLKHA